MRLLWDTMKSRLDGIYHQPHEPRTAVSNSWILLDNWPYSNLPDRKSEIRNPKFKMRVVSLLPSATEIVCALGREAALVGRSHECDFPPSILSLPVCSASRIDTTVSSARIDAQVKGSAHTALSLYDIKADVLQSLRPDLILTQDLCKVCAVSLKDVEEAASRLLGFQAQILALNPATLADVWSDIRRVAAALGAPERGDELTTDLRSRMREVSARANGWGRRPTVASLEWLDPLMAAGNWMPELVELAGGVNLFGANGKHSPWLKFDDLYREDPDVIIALPCGFDLPRTRQEMPALTAQPGWKNLKAVRNGRVHVADGNAFFNRPGPRLAEALEMLAEAIQPAAFSFGHDGMELYGGTPTSLTQAQG
jgi:iron complex transport system substrate-binding protein